MFGQDFLKIIIERAVLRSVTPVPDYSVETLNVSDYSVLDEFAKINDYYLFSNIDLDGYSFNKELLNPDLPIIIADFDHLPTYVMNKYYELESQLNSSVTLNSSIDEKCLLDILKNYSKTPSLIFTNSCCVLSPNFPTLMQSMGFENSKGEANYLLFVSKNYVFR